MAEAWMASEQGWSLDRLKQTEAACEFSMLETTQPSQLQSNPKLCV